jgi:transcriptional regulator with XRE-family HTH domain
LLQAGGSDLTTKQAKELGQQLRDRRERLGLSTHRLAAKAGMTQPTVVRIEQGRFAAPGPDKLARIASVLELKLADLYAHAGYLVPDELPDLESYLAAKYRHLPESAREQLAALARELTERHEAPAAEGAS